MRRRSGIAVLAASFALALLTFSWPSLAKKAKTPDPLPVFPLSIAIATDGEAGRPVRDEAWIDAQIAEAERLFSVCGVHLKKAATRALDARFAHLETRGDRDALLAETEKGKINVMVVASLRDVDDPSLYRMGVHWRPQSNLRKQYIIVAASALPSTLAHELGHYFGNAHTTVPNNVMSYNRTGTTVFFDAAQYTKIATFARLYLRSGEVVP